jgi:hypothetical protein
LYHIGVVAGCGTSLAPPQSGVVIEEAPHLCLNKPSSFDGLLVMVPLLRFKFGSRVLVMELHLQFMGVSSEYTFRNQIKTTGPIMHTAAQWTPFDQIPSVLVDQIPREWLESLGLNKPCPPQVHPFEQPASKSILTPPMPPHCPTQALF